MSEKKADVNETTVKQKVEKVKPKTKEKKVTNNKENNSIQELGNKLQEMSDKYLRLSAEFDNFRKRTLKEKSDLIRNAGEDLILSLLPVVDDFERAVKSMEGKEENDAFCQGIILIYNKLKDSLAGKGLKEMDSIGAEFNTDLHEAITKIPAPNSELKGKVVDAIEKGYFLNDKVIRFAKVVVGE
ncbi:MAG: nucleotide exchange factor GrpE [Bacteroidales bacterium]|nr:nucleotide exchange factor GrpE [Bacteroidales bacterium]